MLAKPRIAIDGVFFQIANSGIARVWHSLLREWVKSGFCQHLLIIDRGGTTPKLPGLTYHHTPLFDFSNPARESIWIQEICDREQIDLFISTYHTTPLLTTSIVLVHDMLPEIFGTDLAVMPLQKKHWSLLHADRYISISHNTAGDLIKFFPHITTDRITIALNGISPDFCPQDVDLITKFRQKYQIEQPFFLVVGNRYASGGFKNVVHFFRAFANLPDRHELEIVCVGGHLALEPELANLAGDTKVSVLSLVDTELMAVYSGAIALVYPSLYEGFGLPILEAMACGCPAIVCANSAIPEVAGDAAMYVSATDIPELTMALMKVREPEVRSPLITAGLMRVKQFSWTQMAETIEQVFIDTYADIHTLRSSTISKFQWAQFRQIQSQSLQLLATTESELVTTQAQLAAARVQIASMESTKFWQLRQQWFRLKKWLRLVDDSE